MTLTNYRDVSKGGTDVHAGFQFEFYCGNCSRTWKSPFKPYRKGQFAGLIYKFAYYLGDRGSMSRASSALAGVGANRASESALHDALELAQTHYAECPSCKKILCDACLNPHTQRCEACDGKGERSSEPRSASLAAAAGGGAASAGLSCPNCRAVFGSGRFCAECGFDMASTHKSCPGCGAMCTRAARFCPDCGNGF